MEHVTVKELALEFELKNSIVISELKKIGVWVPSPETPVDTDIAKRIRKRLQMMVEAEQEGKEKKDDKVGKGPTAKVRRSIRELGKPRKRVARKKTVEEGDQEAQLSSPLAGSMKPRKGRKAVYRRTESIEEEEVPKKVEVTIEDEPVIEPVEAKAPGEGAEAADTPAEVVLETPVEVEAAEPVEVGSAGAQEIEAVVEEIITEEIVGVTEAEMGVAEGIAPVADTGVAGLEEVGSEEAVAAISPADVDEIEVVEPLVRFPETAEAAGVAAPDDDALAVAGAEAVEEHVKPQEVPPVEKFKPTRIKRKKKRQKIRQVAKAQEAPAHGGPREIVFSEKVTVKSFSETVGVRSNEVIKSLMQFGVIAGMNFLLDEKTVEKLCEHFEVIPTFLTFEEAAAREERVADLPEDRVKRAPVVTVMGHVDHGKTSLLDFIRQSHVAAGEAGGITQHIGAYRVNVKGQSIVFIDTPGHEAFTRMRARGAQATDFVVLVVAADDGVMPQTVEAIDHARAANVPIIVAINKIDRPGVKPERVKQQLSERGLVAEDWGGDTVMVEVSAIEGTNVDLLLEMILLVTDLLELTANPERAASGIVLEASMEKGRGVVATLLVQNGTISVGGTLIAGSSWGRVRAMFDDRGTAVNKMGPGSAVEMLGLQGIPLAGDVFQVVEDAPRAREMVEFRQERQREQDLSKSAKVSLDELYARMTEGEAKELAVVLKADTQGSVEVVEDTLARLSNEKVQIELIHRAVGAVTESDVLLASASGAIVIGFNVRPEANAKAAAENEGIEIRLYNVIYDLIEEIEKAMVGLLEPVIRERYLGRAEVRETFRVPKVGTIAGSYVQDGLITRNSEARLLRDNIVVFEGKLGSLRRFKDDVSEVKTGYECGISIVNFNDVKIGDVIEAFVREEVAPQLN